MKEILDKLNMFLQALEDKRGPLLLFVLFLREDSPEKWEIIVSAPWLVADEKNAAEVAAARTQLVFIVAEFTSSSRTVTCSATDPFVIHLQELCLLAKGDFKELPKDFSAELYPKELGSPIKNGYVLRCRKP